MREPSGDGKGTVFRVRLVRFRQEAVWPVLAAMDVADPLAEFDKALACAQEYMAAHWEVEANEEED